MTLIGHPRSLGSTCFDTGHTILVQTTIVGSLFITVFQDTSRLSHPSCTAALVGWPRPVSYRRSQKARLIGNQWRWKNVDDTFSRFHYNISVWRRDRRTGFPYQQLAFAFINECGEPENFIGMARRISQHKAKLLLNVGLTYFHGFGAQISYLRTNRGERLLLLAWNSEQAYFTYDCRDLVNWLMCYITELGIA